MAAPADVPALNSPASGDAKVARALELFKEDSELGGLVQLLAAALELRGMSLTDLDGGYCGLRARGQKQSSGWMVDRASESYCWLQQPGVLDSVSPMAQSSLSHSRLLHFWSVGANRCVGAGVRVSVCASR